MIHDLTGADWRSSTYSQSNGGECIEWAPDYAVRGLVPVRDSKDPAGPALAFSAASWVSFVDAVKRGELPTA
ncbi:DUF397 domain-containing protein [Streptantibioticus rubrisoli]|uniref:DUF397 domain-containing protein n=1 Tax=Streptantibioticus rubrisoli TaxID=1387313 RepID=A0ABT1PPW2_9ACTN|nr:DUF397 domain-containing protein [Streptantibioticus rubrisoli]MCQ4046275.1 DUF397 domain-containing protein [Streptantibioticus rubrisoli]